MSKWCPSCDQRHGDNDECVTIESLEEQAERNRAEIDTLEAQLAIAVKFLSMMDNGKVEPLACAAAHEALAKIKELEGKRD